jgi:iron complex outermembrane receptor protein
VTALFLLPTAYGETSADTTASGQLEQAPELQQVTVTARYRSESAQDVPISLSVVSAADIQERGYSSVVDAAKALPNVLLTPTGQQSGGTVGVLIRGVGQTDFGFTLQPGVGIYIDDVYQGTLFGSQFGLLDVDNIQVLRGPQGTLAGRNSEGGAIHIHTVRPRGDDSGYAELGYGNYSHQIARGAYDFALIADRLFVRVAAGLDKMDGYTARFDYGCAHPGSMVPAQTADPGCKLGSEGGTDARSVRINVRGIIREGLTVDVAANAFQDHGEPAANKTVQIVTSLGGRPTIAGLLNLTHPGLNYGSSSLTSNLYSNYDIFSYPLSGAAYSGRNYSPQNDLTAFGTSATVNWSLSRAITLKSISGYSDYRGIFTASNTAPFGSINYQDLTHHQFTEELQLTGVALNSLLDWTLGGFYLTARSVDRGENLLSGLGNDFWQDEPATDHNDSVFGHLDYHLTSKLSAEAGVRYSQDESSYTFNRYYLAPFAIFPAGAPVVTNRRYSTTSGRTDYKGALSYQWTPEVMTYAQVSTGYKAGGINPRVTSDATVTTFKPEHLTSYEVGAKTEWLDRRLRFNIDGFLGDYKDLQLSATQAVPGGFQVVYQNVGHVHISGVEAELTARPNSALSFDLSGSWLHYRALDLGTAAYDAVNNTGGIIPGSPPPYTPTWKGAVGGQYSIPFGNAGGSLTARVDGTYQSRMYFDNQGTLASSQGGYGLLNAALTWVSSDNAWRASLRADNALGKGYFVSMSNLINPLGILSGQPARPRTVLISVRRSFGGGE